MMTRSTFLIGTLFLWIINSGCAEQYSGYGSARFGVVSSALSSDDIDHIVVTVSGEHIDPDVKTILTEHPVDGWTGLIEQIPAGDGRLFSAQAFDSAGTVIYEGSAEDVTITDGLTIQVIIYLQQLEAPDPFTNAVPRFDSVVLTKTKVAPTHEIEVIASATDPDQDPLSYSWSATCGSFDDVSSPHIIWTAPTTEGRCTLSVSATDPQNASATISFEIDVRIHYGSGDADVLLNINTWPEVHGLVPQPTRIEVGESTNLDLIAVDPDGDPLSFSWAADCVGTFSDSTVQDPSFTLDEDNGDHDCGLSVTVSDGLGGVNTARIAIATGAPIDIDTDSEMDTDTDTGINTGDLHLLFVTEAQFTGDLIGQANQLTGSSFGPAEWMAASEALCTHSATTAGLQGRYVALLKRGTEDTLDLISDADGPWARPDGLPLADTVADLRDGNFRIPTNITEYGERIPSSRYAWRGSSTNDCAGWQNATEDYRGEIGSPGYFGRFWNRNSRPNCNYKSHLICAQIGPNGGPNPWPTPPGPDQLVVFTTANQYTGDLVTASGLPSPTAYEAADHLCNLEAEANGLDGLFRAWISDSGVSARTRFENFGMVGPWYATDGFLVVPSLNELIQLQQPLPMIMGPNAAKVDYYTTVWTNTRAAGDGHTVHCNNFSSASAEEAGYVGRVYHNNREWTYRQNLACSELAALYCFEQ